MTTTIKSLFGHELTVEESRTCPGRTALACESEGCHVRLFPTAELLDALNAEPKTVAQQLRFELKAADADAEGLRAKLAEAERGLDTTRELEAEIANWKSRTGHAESVIGNYLNSNVALNERAEAAEAKLARVKAVLNGIGRNSLFVSEVRAALADPEPPFVLPTEAGAGISAQRSGLGAERELRLYSDGKWRDSLGYRWAAVEVMSEFTGHRVIDGGAE